MEMKTFLLAAALVAAMSQTPAAAGEFEFRYKSYELETSGGRADMMARLDRSVARFCDGGAARSLNARRSAEDCRVDVKAEVMAKIENASVASLNR